MLFVGTSIIHPSTEGVFLLCNILDLLIYSYDEVITAIAKKKQDIQFIFATHNANIPVLGDAERIFVVEYQDTTIDISQGNIDLKSTHKQIVDIMEGGEEAFDKRQLIYTSWK